MFLKPLSMLCIVTFFGAAASRSYFYSPFTDALSALSPQLFHLRTATPVQPTAQEPVSPPVRTSDHFLTQRNASSRPEADGPVPVVRTYCHNVKRRCGEDCVDIPGEPYPCEKWIPVPKMCTKQVKEKVPCTGTKSCNRKRVRKTTCEKTVKKKKKCPPKLVTYKCKKKIKVKKTCTKEMRSKSCKKALNTKCKKGKKTKEYKCKKIVSAICTKWEDCLKVRKVKKPCKKRVQKRIEVKCDSSVSLTPRKSTPQDEVLSRRTPKPKNPSPTPQSSGPPKYKVIYGRTPGFSTSPWPSPSSSPSTAVLPATQSPSASPSTSSEPSASPSSSSKPSTTPSSSASVSPFVNTYKTRSVFNPSPSASSSAPSAVKPKKFVPKPTDSSAAKVGEAACACLNNGLDDSTNECKNAPPACQLMNDLFDTEVCNKLCCKFCGNGTDARKEDLELTDFCAAHNEYVCSTTDMTVGARKMDFNVRASLYALDRVLLGESGESALDEDEDEDPDASIAEVERSGTKKCFKKVWVEEDSKCETTEQFKSRCSRMTGCKKKVDSTCTKVVEEIVNKPCKGHASTVCKKKIPVKYECGFTTKTVRGKCKKKVRKGKCMVDVKVKYPCKKTVMEKVPCPNKRCDKMVTKKYRCGLRTAKKMKTCYKPGGKDCRPKYCETRVCDKAPPRY